MTKVAANRTASCQCGQVTVDVAGAPIVRAVCYCNSCRTAGLAFANAAGAPAVVDGDGGTDLLLYRKDRIGPIVHGELLRENRLTPNSPTRRLVASCCDTPMFLEFTKGHWLSFYTSQVSGPAVPLGLRTMTADRPAGPPLPDDVPNHPAQSGRFMLKLLAAWAAMGFRRLQVAW